MTAQEIQKVLVNALKNKKFVFWMFIRLVSAFGPLLATYLFSRGIDALETHGDISIVMREFGLLLLVWSTEHFTRVGSKTRLSIVTEVALIEIQERLVTKVEKTIPNRKEIIQSIRNVTQALRNFSTHFRDNAISGLVSFVSIPVILYFIDKRIFGFELMLMGFYLVVTLIFAKIYEKRYELFDKSREYYYGKIQSSNEVEEEAEYVRHRIRQVEDVQFFQWASLQNIIAVSQFIVLYIISKDIIAGTKHISDLVLIFGYTTSTGTFLNGITGMIERLMQVKAGIERLVVVSNKEKPVSSLV
jgi:ABC-type multidrug transport system fused ATPase/permease subunit